MANEDQTKELVDASAKVAESLENVSNALKKLQNVVDETIAKFNAMKASPQLNSALLSQEFPGVTNQNPLTLAQHVTFTKEEMQAQNAHGVESV